MAPGALRASADFGGKRYSIKPVWANDYDEDACATYANNIRGGGHEGVICLDVKNLEFATLPAIDGLSFGFPCNDFSAVGERKGTRGSFGPLYSYGVKALKHFRPKWVLAENVGGLHHANEGEDLKKILAEMCAAGYDVFPHLYRFEQYGVPQKQAPHPDRGLPERPEADVPNPRSNDPRAQDGEAGSGEPSDSRRCREQREDCPIRPGGGAAEPHPPRRERLRGERPHEPTAQHPSGTHQPDLPQAGP